MSPALRNLISGLLYDGGIRSVSPEQFLDRAGVTDGHRLAAALLRQAAHDQDPVDLEYALLVLVSFATRIEDLDVLSALAEAEWHTRHEDVVHRVDDLRTVHAVDLLHRLALRQPASRDPIDAQTLADNAVWALSRIDGAGAERALTEIARSGRGPARLAAERLRHRRVTSADHRRPDPG